MNEIFPIFSEGPILPENETDEIFSHLEQFEPPADFVERIMSVVSRLPLPQLMPKSPVEEVLLPKVPGTTKKV